MKYPSVSPSSSVTLVDNTPSSSPSGSVKTKATRSRAGAMLRRFSDLDLSTFKKIVDRRSVQSLPADIGRGVRAYEAHPRVDPKLQAELHKIVAKVHQGIQAVADEDPSMASGLAVVGKLTRADEIAAFRRLFITQPGVALSKLIYNATDLRLSDSIVSLISNRFLSPSARAMLFDALMAEPLTANLIKLISTKRSFLRIGIKMRRAMLYKVTAEGRPPQEASSLSPAETLQASSLLFKKENLTAAQITVDTILMGIGNDVPGLVGTLVQELFVDDKTRIHGYAGMLATEMSTKIHTFLQAKMPNNKFDLKTQTAANTKLLSDLADGIWRGDVVEKILGKYVGEEKAGTFIERLQREGERIAQLAARLAAAKG